VRRTGVAVETSKYIYITINLYEQFYGRNRKRLAWVQGAAMSAPARRHDADDIPTRCPCGDFKNLAGIRGSSPPSGPEARWEFSRSGLACETAGPVRSISTNRFLK
jgi:hypothetical protein